MKYRAVKICGYGECVSNNINYIIDNVEKWCGPYFDLYVDGVKVDNLKEYLRRNKPKTLEEKIIDMCYEKDQLKEENKQLKADYELYKDNHIYKNYEVERKDKQLDLYKSVIEEVREDIVFCINNMKNEYACTDSRTNRELHTMVKILEDRLQILDKAKENK